MNPFVPELQQRGLALASTSPRRATILRMLGFEFDVVTAPVDEDVDGLADPEAHVLQLAERKVREAARQRGHGILVSADTVVAIDDQILNKPRSRDEAIAMQRRLRGRWHEVFTGVALFAPKRRRFVSGAERTEVLFADWDDAALERYVTTGECMDKAGAYAIQGMGALLVREIRGCYYNVMGFPIQTFARLLGTLHDRAELDAG